MGDPLSIAASVAGLITISAQIVGMAKELFGKVKDAPETMMKMREEVESMQPIFSQVQLLLNGSGKGVNHANLTMISVHNLMSTLTGCVIVYDKLEKKVNEVCGFNDPTIATAMWKRAGVIADRVKWGLWRHEEVMCIIEDLQRQKRSLNLMVTIITCTTTNEVSARLQEICMENLQSSHAHSVLLRELISRQDAVLIRQDEQARILEELRDRPYTSTLGGTGSTGVSTCPPSTDSNRDNSDNASIMSKRSTLSLRFGPPSYMEDLKASRAYKRLRHFGREIDSSESVFSLGSGCTTGNWSMLSDITLGDLSVSQIAVLNLPIDMSDVSNPEPFQYQHSIEKPRSLNRLWSSRGRIHNAIESGNEFVVRTVLGMGMDVEELDANGRTPFVHAVVKQQESICKLLLEKGASVGALEAFTSGMDLKESSELLDPLTTRCLDDGATSVYGLVLRLLVSIVLGTNGGKHVDGSSSRSLMNIAIDMSYELAVRAIIHLEPRVLVEVDIAGRTPLVHAVVKQREGICTLLLEKNANVGALKAFTSGMDLKERSGLLDPLITRGLDGGTNSVYVPVLRLLVLLVLHINDGEDGNGSSSQSLLKVAIDMKYGLAARAIIHLEPQVLVEVDIEGRTPFGYAYHLRRNEICELLLQCAIVDIETAAEVVKLEGHFAGRVHTLIEERCPQVLRLLLAMDVDVGADECIDMEGRTPLTHAAEVVLNSEDINYRSWSYIFKAFLEKASNADIETVKKIRPKPGARRCITTSMHELVRKNYQSILQLLSLTESHDSEGWTPLASAAFNNNEALCALLVEKGCSLCLDIEQKKQLKPKLSCRIHVAAKGGNKTALQLLLDMGADINERNSENFDRTALLDAVFYNHLSCVKLLIKRGADATISSIEQRTVLHYAAYDGHEQIMKFLLDDVVETRKLVDMKDSYGDTALHDCRYFYGRPAAAVEIARMLLQAGATLTIKNNGRKTPYEYARNWPRKELAKYLWSQLSPEQQAQEIPPPSD